MNIFKMMQQNYCKMVNKLWRFIRNCLNIEESLVQKRIKFYEVEIETERIEVEKSSKNERIRKIDKKIEQYQAFLNSIIEKNGIIPEKYENACISTVDMGCNAKLMLENTKKCSSNELLTDSPIIESTVSKHNSYVEDSMTHSAMTLTEDLNDLKEFSAYSDEIITLLDKSSIVISSIRKKNDTYKCESELHLRTINELSNRTGPEMNTIATQTDPTNQNIKLKVRYKKRMESTIQKLKTKLIMEKKLIALYKKNEKHIKSMENESIPRLEEVIKHLECQERVYKDKNVKLAEENKHLNEKIKDIGISKYKLKNIKSELCSAQESLKISNEENKCLNTKMQSLLDSNTKQIDSQLQNKVCVKSTGCQTDITEEQLLDDILLTSETRYSELEIYQSSTDLLC